MAQPVFGFLAFTSGAYEGAIIRDMRLANALHRRGHKVVVYWMMETNFELVDPGITQRILCTGLRYHFARPSILMDFVGRLARVAPPVDRRDFIQERPAYVARLIGNCCRAMGEGDPGLTRRLERFLVSDGVTHLLPTFAMICPVAEPIKEGRRHAFDYLVTFQGEEIFANYAERVGHLEEFYRRLRVTVAGSRWPAVAVSRDYARRLHEEMGIDPARMTPIPPGIELPNDVAVMKAASLGLLRDAFPSLSADVPIVAYVGRHDAEKGIDLLLYAANIVRRRGIRFQLVCAGASSFGEQYLEACRGIAEHLRLPVLWAQGIPHRVRDALLVRSRCVVCPSIHREPFGMVAAEAMSHGTPVLVPDQGGVLEIIADGDRRGGLTFKAWDSGALAAELERLLVDDTLHAELAANARELAARFSVERLVERVLAHMGIEEAGSDSRLPSKA